MTDPTPQTAGQRLAEGLWMDGFSTTVSYGKWLDVVSEQIDGAIREAEAATREECAKLAEAESDASTCSYDGPPHGRRGAEDMKDKLVLQIGYKRCSISEAIRILMKAELQGATHATVNIQWRGQPKREFVELTDDQRRRLTKQRSQHTAEGGKG